jgi:hypothetical protein
MRRAEYKKMDYRLTAPDGMHLMGFHGRAGTEIFQIGAYWGKGGGSAEWKAIQNCWGCGSHAYEYTSCTEKSGSDSTTKTKSWSIGVTKELSFGFFGMGSKLKIESKYSRSVVEKTERSFRDSTCVKKSFTCDKQYLWQWTYTSNFDGQGAVLTTTDALACTDEPRPCCMPFTFSKRASPTNCDLDPSAPNTCGGKR